MVKALIRGKKEVEMDAKSAISIFKLIKNGLGLKILMAISKAKLEKNNEKLIPFAENLAESTGLKSSTFKTELGSVTVKFTDGISYDEKDMPKIKKALGPLYTKMFTEIPMYTVNPDDIPEIKNKLGEDFTRLLGEQPSYKPTLELRKLLCDADNERGKKVREYVSIVNNKPTVTYERVEVPVITLDATKKAI